MNDDTLGTGPEEPAMERSFELLADEHRPMLSCYLTGLLGESHLAEDLVQETFLTAHHKLEQFETGNSFGAWLRGIARNKVREHRRAAARRPLVVDSRIVEGMEEVFGLFDVPSPAGDSWGDRLEAIRNCVGKLKGALRGAIDCVYTRGLSLREAASELGASAEAVGQRVSRARKQIRLCAEQQVAKLQGQ